MFRYFARLHEKFDLPIYPIVIFSYDQPKKQAINYYQFEFPDFQVLQFNYRVIQLNRLTARELEIFNQEFEQIESTAVKEDIMEITTSWKEEGKEKGKQELILHLLNHRLGELSSETQAEIMSLNSSQLEELGVAMFNLENEDDLNSWLANSPTNN